MCENKWWSDSNPWPVDPKASVVPINHSAQLGIMYRAVILVLSYFRILAVLFDLGLRLTLTSHSMRTSSSLLYDTNLTKNMGFSRWNFDSISSTSWDTRCFRCVGYRIWNLWLLLTTHRVHTKWVNWLRLSDHCRLADHDEIVYVLPLLK